MALNGVSFEVKKGERVGIIGHNGAGKSTLLKLISRITAPTGGTICLNGRVASMLEVGTGFHPELTGRENIYMNGAILGMTRKEIDAKMEDIIEFSECRQFIDTPVKRYSSGMYVKLAFSVAAHLDSEILIMDEVLAVGDMAFQKKCLDKMNDVSKKEGRTILYVSHNMNTIRQLCERVIVLDHGRVLFDGNVEDGIKKYLNNNSDSNEVSYDYSSYFKSPYYKRTVQMIGLDLIDRDSNCVVLGENVKIVLHCRANTDVRNVGLRFEAVFSDGSLVGTTFLNTSVSMPGENCFDLHLLMPTNNFAPGRYSFIAVFFETDTYGNQDVIDRVEPAMSLEMIERQDNEAFWIHSWLGHVHLEDITLEKTSVI